MRTNRKRRLAAIMFADIVGYTSLMEGDEAQAIAVRQRHRSVFEKHHPRFNGEIIQYYGDGALSVFDSAVEAVQCATKIQQLLSNGQPTVPIRIGIHLGDIILDETEIYGEGVNLASRIESMGVPGAVLISGSINQELRNKPDLASQSLGEFNFKNIKDPVEVFAIKASGLIVPEPSELKGKFENALKSIAVLPFVNMSSDPHNEYFSDGITEEIINALTRVKGLKVTSRTSSFYFKNKQVSIRKVGQTLNVSTVLEGSIRLAGNKMRITVQLIDVTDDVHFWSETFDRSTEDIFAVQDEISLLIADRLREQLGHLDIGDHLVPKTPVPASIYQHYLKSRYEILKMSQEGISAGIDLLEEVLSKYPDYPYAHLGMHMGYTMYGTLGFMPAAEAFAKGQTYLDQAIRLDDTLPECYLQQSWMSFLQHWDLESTYSYLNKALEIQPTVDFYQTMTSTLVAEAKYEAALHYINIAIQLDPLSEINYHLKGFIHYCKKEYDEAIALFHQSIQLKPASELSITYIGQALILKGQTQEALAYFQNISADKDKIIKIGGETLVYASEGNIEAAQKGISALQAARSSASMDRAMHYLILSYTALSDYDKAMELIKEAITYRLPLSVYLYTEPLLEKLHQDQRFAQLMHEVLGDRTTFDGPKRKYKKSLFTNAELQKHKTALIALMDEQAPYLNPQLTLRKLADMMDMPANELSQLLNEGFDQNFAELINSYRLEAFKTKVNQKEHHSHTILALAYDSGFNSKTVFNTYFKKTMGQTPKHYLNSIEEE